MGQISLVGQAAALHNLASNGLITRTAASTVAARSLSAGGGINVQNSDGVSGNPGIQLSNQAKALNAFANNGVLYRTAANTFTSMLTGGIGLGFFPNYDSVPPTNISPGAPGEIAIGNTAGVTYFYVCTATDRWGRVQISSW